MKVVRARLVIATRNPGKLREFRRLLAGTGLEVISLDDAGVAGTVDETGSTYEENARLKAVGYYRRSRLATLADDSGVEVDALDGRPGVDSAVFTGPEQSDSQRTDRLLEMLADVPDRLRTARYRAVLVIAGPGRAAGPDPAEVGVFTGTCEGAIARAPRGTGGFGYDPVFLVEGGGRSMAELSDQEKDRVSHRGNAARAAMGFLRKLHGYT